MSEREDPTSKQDLKLTIIIINCNLLKKTEQKMA